MKIDIIVVYRQRYRRGHEVDFVPPISGIHLAALTPRHHQVRVIHQQVETVATDSDAEVIALSFFSGFAPEAYRLARIFRARGKTVVAGGPHVSFSPEEALQYCDSVVIGEAETAWPRLLADLENGVLQSRYQGGPAHLAGLPTPRYDLLPPRFFVPRVVQATRGCPFSCAFCSVPNYNPGFRTRPVAEVLADIRYDRFKHWWQRKVVWFWDDNLTIRRPYIKQLLSAMIPLKRWWLTQASLDIAKDRALLDLMRDSGCIGIFFGIESFSPASLQDARKPQNQARDYQRSIAALHRRGICVMAGFIAGFDNDTPESIRAMAEQLYQAGVDVPFVSILTPYRGTGLYTRLAEEQRLLDERGWEFYNGYNVTFRPRTMSPEALLAAHRALWRAAFSPSYALRRIFRALFYLRPGAFLMCACMNLFYCWKAVRGNLPINFAQSEELQDERHPSPKNRHVFRRP